MKRMSVFVAIAFIMILAAGSVTAAISVGDGRSFVIDEAGLLTATQRDELEKRARRITEEYACEVRIVTLASIGELRPMHVSNALYFDNDFGYGPERSCVLFFVSIEDRDFDLAVWGFGDTAFTEHGKDVILDKHILPFMKVDKFYEAFTAYLDKTEDFLAMARNGSVFDINTDPDIISRVATTSLIARLGIIILLPMLLAAHICAYWEKQMKTAVIARTAHNYIPANGFNLSGREDTFLYRTVSRVKIEQTSSGGSSSRSVRSSSGGSHRSGKF